MGALNKLEILVLNYIAKKLVKQGEHEAGIIYFYTAVNIAARDEFTEDTKYVLDQFLTDCHNHSLDAKTPCNHNWVSADNEVIKGGLICTNCHNVKAT